MNARKFLVFFFSTSFVKSSDLVEAIASHRVASAYLFGLASLFFLLSFGRLRPFRRLSTFRLTARESRGATPYIFSACAYIPDRPMEL